MSGDVANKVGTLQIAIAAKEFGVPLYIAAAPDPSTPSGEDIPIEYRDPDEIFCGGWGIKLPKVFDAMYPAFDVTPAEYITGIITHKGVFRPQEVCKFFER